MEKLLKLYTYINGINDTPFPNADEQIIIGSFTYNAGRMAGAPSISATIKHRLCLDNLWSEKVYAEFNVEKYFVINTPSSSKSNDDTRYEHDLELLSEREVLNHVYFIDAVQGDSDVDQYKSNSTEVLFYGGLNQFVERLNASLSYSGLDYSVVIDDEITSEEKQVQFSDLYIMQALQQGFELFGVPYYFSGKVIHFGYTDNAIPTILKYGHDSAFLSVSKENANYQVINRITGTGSSDNIPYYYPNDTDDRSEIESSGGKWITPSQNLMPPIYRESLGAQRFYNAKNNTYPNGSGGYYGFENEYTESNPLEGITTFEDIKPSIVGTTNAQGQRIDMFVEFAYDLNDNDEMDEEGNYLHPYFFAKLRKTDGAYGFNLFDQAIEQQAMQISFTSGICGACTFGIGVGEETQKNTVQVSDTGELLRDEKGNVRYGTEENPETPQDRQNDTRNYEVWLALKKDINTYPQIMPNVGYNYKPSVNDTFVILGINLPKGYILKAEQDLEDALIKYMWENNMEKFNFSAKFSRIFFEENPEVLESLNENSRVIIEYNGLQHTLYVNEYTYKIESSSPLPEIEISLVDTLTVGQNTLQSMVESIAQNLFSSSGGDVLAQGMKYFLRKDVSDIAQGVITFTKGANFGGDTRSSAYIGGWDGIGWDITSSGDAEFQSLKVRDSIYLGGRLGSESFVSGFPNGYGWEITPYKRTNAAGTEETKYKLEIDDISVRGTLRAYEFVISQMRGENDNYIFAGMMRVDHYDPSTRRIYLDTEEGVLYNPFKSGDILMVQRFGGIPTLENDYNIIKQYELQVDETGIGSLSEGEGRLDWITFTNFTGDIEDIASRDILVRVDSATDSTRKGVVTVTTINETGAPYIDVVYGMKTDPENATKARMGNLTGIRTKNGIDLTGVWGIYGNGAYFENSTYILDNGNTVEQQFSIMNGQLNSLIGEVRNDMSLEDGNVLVNSTFSSDTAYWVTDNEVHFYALNGVFLWDGDEFMSEKGDIADITADGGRNVLRIRNSKIYQENNVMELPTRPETPEGEEAEAYTYSFSLFYKAISAGTLSVGIEGSGLWLTQQLQPTENYLKLSNVGKWDETGNFSIAYTGEIYIYGVSLFNDALADAEIRLQTQITQNAEEIALRATKAYVDSSTGTVYKELMSEISVTAEEINLSVTEKVDNVTALVQQAQTTADNAMDAATDISDSVTDLNDYVDGAFKDGIIDSAEAKAIEKYINTVNSLKDEMDSTYSKLYNNPNLSGSPKSNLYSAKNTFNTATTNLLNAINTAISDGEVNATEKNTVDSRFDSFNSAYSSLATAIEAANEAIQEALKDYSDAIKTELHSEIQVEAGKISANSTAIDEINNTIDTAGWITTAEGNTLFARRYELESVTDEVMLLETRIEQTEDSIGLFVTQADVDKSVSDAVDAINVGVRNYAQGTGEEFEVKEFKNVSNQVVETPYVCSNLQKGDVITLSFDYRYFGLTFDEEVMGYTGITPQFDSVYSNIGLGIDEIKKVDGELVTGHISVQMTIGNRAGTYFPVTVTDKSYLQLRIDYVSAASTGYFLIRNVMVNKGEHESDWVPAPEDGLTEEKVVAGITLGENGILVFGKEISLVGKVKADWIDVDNLVAKNIETTTGSIGAFNIDNYGLINEVANPTAYIKIGNEADEFIYMNGDYSHSMLSVRSENKNYAVYLQAYGTKTSALSIIGGSTNGYAIDSSGSHRFYQAPNKTWNAPGVLTALKVNGSGTVVSRWGNGLNRDAIVNKRTTGTYRVTHNLERTTYYVAITGLHSTRWSMGQIIDHSSNYFDYQMVDPGGGIIDSDAFVMIIGHNKIT